MGLGLNHVYWWTKPGQPLRDLAPWMQEDGNKEKHRVRIVTYNVDDELHPKNHFRPWKRATMARTMPKDSQRRLQDLPVSSLSLWTQPCTDQHLWRMSQLISDWREMAPALGLSRTDEMNIMEYAPHSPRAQRVEMLRTWRYKLGTAATYSRLADAFSQCGKQDLVDAITELVTDASAESGELPCGEGTCIHVCVLHIFWGHTYSIVSMVTPRVQCALISDSWGWHCWIAKYN